MKFRAVLAMAALAALPVHAADGDGEVVFRSDVSLVRVDVQVLDSGGGSITGLTAQDFEIRDNGKRVAIRNLVREEMPIDVLFLLDVSGSMQPHIQSVANASRQALTALGPDDRVAVMVFDRSTRLRSPFKPSREAYRELDRVIREESFNGGTDVTGALRDAAEYVGRQGRREGRRAIIIVTDDQTEFRSDVPGIVRLLAKNDIVLSALIAPDAMGNRVGFPGGGRRTGGSTWPGGLGWPFPGGGWPGGGGTTGRRGGGGPTIPIGRGGAAGSPQIAVESGGDSFDVDEARALETTLERLRQRYALFFHAPGGSREGEERTIAVTLVGSAARRHASSELKFRRSYIASEVPDDGSDTGEEPPAITSTEGSSARNSPDPGDDTRPTGGFKRRPAVSEGSGGSGPNPNLGGGWRREDTPQHDPEPVYTPPAVESKQPETKQSGGWRKATPEDLK